MAHSTIAAIVIPIVVVAVLAVWLGSVYFARRHPANKGNPPPLSHEVAGGAFESSGGRQVMPRRDATPAEAAGQQQEGPPA